jgi:RNA polymerase sigma-70 factor, ECF subfamily
MKTSSDRQFDQQLNRATDQELLAELKRNPEKAFRTLYDRYSGVLLRFIFRFTGQQPLAEDILHDVFSELLTSSPVHMSEQGLKSWLFTVAKNKSLNAIRRGAIELSSTEIAESTRTHDHSEESQQLEINLEKLKALEKTLPQDLAEPWRLRRQGLDYREIADQLAIPLGTVKSRFHRLVLFLREEFEK